ncbi:MAG TPA: class I SAM-dependent methyltransferase [Rubellimicrobium sp.]|jgi:SAM-dependent methyltransferase|nr:class I SAM-dependent methyltransferase [Rubellimicrobium sp.]
MPEESLGEIVSRLAASAQALAAIGQALDARQSGTPPAPGVAPHLDAVLAELGVADLISQASDLERLTLLGEIRTFALANARMLFGASSGWTHREPELLEAAGDVSAGVPHRIRSALAPRLAGLAERLETPGAGFLDIGVGVARMSIEMARLWPNLAVVGIEPLPQALELARGKVRAEGLEDRIELREGRGEDLRDEDRFDLAWVPSLFIPEPAVPRVLARVHAALRPGGWVLVPSVKPSEDPLATALVRLRVAGFGGMNGTPATVEGLLRAAGYAEVATLPGPPQATGAMVVGRKAQTA